MPPAHLDGWTKQPTPPTGQTRMKGPGIVGAIVCACAGVYLLLWQSAGDESNWFEVVTRGLGIYFIGKGLFIWSMVRGNEDQLTELRKIAGTPEHPKPSAPTIKPLYTKDDPPTG